ncbi:unnamed protein product [Somion occarium]|uniref:Uncharacterized protein n=1 Tax=Somion occarium TaxID=3059160 RepID=A0ABP1D740_9APHY
MRLCSRCSARLREARDGQWILRRRRRFGHQTRVVREGVSGKRVERGEDGVGHGGRLVVVMVVVNDQEFRCVAEGIPRRLYVWNTVRALLLECGDAWSRNMTDVWGKGAGEQE